MGVCGNISNDGAGFYLIPAIQCLQYLTGCLTGHLTDDFAVALGFFPDIQIIIHLGNDQVIILVDGHGLHIQLAAFIQGIGHFCVISGNVTFFYLYPSILLSQDHIALAHKGLSHHIAGVQFRCLPDIQVIGCDSGPQLHQFLCLFPGFIP